jgi:hypothetical protein
VDDGRVSFAGGAAAFRTQRTGRAEFAVDAELLLETIEKAANVQLKGVGMMA